MTSQRGEMTADANVEEIPGTDERRPTSDERRDLASSPTDDSAGAEGDRIYALSRDGRRTAVILLLGVATIWIFALWSLITILDDGITGVEWVSSLLMLGILLVAPMVAWTVHEEMNSRISVSDAGVRYRSLGGIDLAYKWDDLAGFQQVGRRGRVARFFLGEEEPHTVSTDSSAVVDDEPEEEPKTKLLRVRDARATRISNPVVGFLHRQAHGAAVPIYGGIEKREELLGEIRARLQR